MKRKECLIEILEGCRTRTSAKRTARAIMQMACQLQHRLSSQTAVLPSRLQLKCTLVRRLVAKILLPSTHVMHNVPLVSHRKLTCLNALSSFLPGDRHGSKREQQLGDAAASSGAAAAAFQPT